MRSAASDTTEYVVVDVETTGLSVRHDRIVEIACVLTDAVGQPFYEWHRLINPGIPLRAQHIHQINPVDVRNAPMMDDVLPTLVALFTGRTLVAHRLNFDRGFLQAAYERAGTSWAQPATLCTYELSYRHLPSLRRRRLIDCCRAYGISCPHQHSALSDARATATLLRCFLCDPPKPASA